MKKTVLAITCLLMLSACNKKPEANLETLTKGMNDYLARRGEFCLAKTNWPIDVTQHEMDAHARNALQMPVMEKLGLVLSSIATIDAKDDESDVAKPIKVMRYQLTDTGKKYYLQQPPRRNAAGELTEIPGDFCAAKLRLDRIVSWTPPVKKNGVEQTTVTYTYDVDAAPWTKDAQIQKVFPMVDYIVTGGKKVQLKERFKMTPHGWESMDL
jgi:hypothetical protein